MIRLVIHHGTFGGALDDREHTIAVFDRHVEQVTREVDPQRLLVYEVAQGWGALCEFLGVAMPDTPFPRLNGSAEFDGTIRAGSRRRLLTEAAPTTPALAGLAGLGLFAAVRQRRIRLGHA